MLPKLKFLFYYYRDLSIMAVNFVVALVIVIAYFAILALFAILAGVYKSKCDKDPNSTACGKQKAFTIIAVILAIPVLIVGGGVSFYRYRR